MRRRLRPFCLVYQIAQSKMLSEVAMSALLTFVCSAASGSFVPKAVECCKSLERPQSAQSPDRRRDRVLVPVSEM